MKSMTGYGCSEYNDKHINMGVEIRSYNNRYLDINIYVPAYLNRLEECSRKHINTNIKRGRVEVVIAIRNYEEDLEVIVDEKNVGAHTAALKKLIKAAGLKDVIHLSHLLRIEGLLKTKKNYDLEYFQEIYEPVLKDALEKLDQTRIKEGFHLEKNIRAMVTKIKSEMAKIKKNIPLIEENIKEKLRERFKELLGDQMDEARILSETALMLIKCDINEELVRIDSHLEHFIAVMNNEPTVGKKLDFICQELNREINTISSKSIIYNINNSVIIIKDLIEKIREQLRNVE